MITINKHLTRWKLVILMQTMFFMPRVLHLLLTRLNIIILDISNYEH